MTEGYINGIIKAAREDIIQILEIRFGKISQSVIDKLNMVNDHSVLKNILKKAVEIKKIEVFEDMLLNLNKHLFH